MLEKFVSKHRNIASEIAVDVTNFVKTEIFDSESSNFNILLKISQSFERFDRMLRLYIIYHSFRFYDSHEFNSISSRKIQI